MIKFEEQKNEIDSLKALAQIALKSGNYGGMTESTMLNIMLSAKDLGISPMKALNGGFYVVNGKIAMSTSLMVDRIRKDGHSIKIPEWTSQKCVVIGIRKDNGDSVKVEFTWEDAIAAGLTGSPTWKKYPKAMLYNRAMSMIARVLFPDVVGNCYSEDEGEEIKRAGKPVSKEVAEEKVEEVEIVQLTHEEIADAITCNIQIDDEKKLIEYLKFCETKITKPLTEMVRQWLNKPDLFKERFEAWCAKQEFAKNDKPVHAVEHQDDLFS